MNKSELGDKFVFYTCVLAAIVLFFVAGDLMACTENKTTLNRIEKQLIARMYELEIKKDDICLTDSCVKDLKISIEEKAKQIVYDNFSCKEAAKLFKIEVLKELREKQAKY